MENGSSEESSISVFLSNSQINIILSCAILMCVPIMYRVRRKSTEAKPGDDIVYNKECPICFNVFLFPVKSNCGHAFCIDCIYNYWEKSSWKASCPLCRASLKHLQLLKDEDNYSYSTKQYVLKKINKICKQSTFIYNILSVPINGYMHGILFSLVWTLAIINMDKLVQYAVLTHTYFYNTRSEIKI